jgi:hypothetical protein
MQLIKTHKWEVTFARVTFQKKYNFISNENKQSVS